MKIRKTARAIIRNEEGEILLQEFVFQRKTGSVELWVTPGGGIEENESPEKALERELFEELGINILIEEKALVEIDAYIEDRNGDFISRDIFYEIYLETSRPITMDNFEEIEKDTFVDLKWWTIDEIRLLDNFVPKEILDYL